MAKKLVLILAVVGLGFFLRVWQLDQYPVSLFGDEVDLGYHAFSILKTGKDYYADSWPVIFHSFSEYRLPLNMYATVPFIAAFGLNEWGVRLPFVIFGMLSLIGMLFLTKELFGLRLALIATTLMAISPWALHFSRQANDAGGLLALEILGVWAFVWGLKNYPGLIISAVLFALSIYDYSIATVFAPLIVITLLVIYRDKINPKKLIIPVILGIVVLLPYFNLIISGVAAERFSKINLFSDSSIVEDVVRRRVQDHNLFASIFLNKPVAIFLEFSRNYLKAFSSNFLFINGDPNLRHSVGGVGELYLFEIITILLGIFEICKKFIKQEFKLQPNIRLLIIWLLIAPIMSSLTKDGGEHATRLILLLPPLIILSALGVNQLIGFIKINWVKPVLGIFLTLVIFNIGQYFYRYYVEWPNDSWRFWHYGFKQAMQYSKSVDNQFDRIYINNTYEPSLPRFLFWYQYDPGLFQKQFTKDQSVKNVAKYFDGFPLGDKYYFGSFQKPIQNIIQSNYLIIASAREDITDPSILKSPAIRLLKIVYAPTGEPIFYIFTGEGDKK